MLNELAVEDPGQYKNFLRMVPEDLEDLLAKIGPVISRQTSCIKLFKTGDSYASLALTFRIPQCTISHFIPEVCSAIFDKLKEDYLQVTSNWGYNFGVKLTIREL